MYGPDRLIAALQARRAPSGDLSTLAALFGRTVVFLIRSNMANLLTTLLLLGALGSAGCGDAGTMTNTPPPPAKQPAEPPAQPQPADSAPPPASAPAPAPEAAPAPAPAVYSFAVDTLSRGTGVPEEAKDAARRVVAMAEEDRARGVKVTIGKPEVIGLEGERRVCIAYDDAEEGSRAYERAREIVRGVDLINLTVEPCKQEKES